MAVLNQHKRTTIAAGLLLVYKSYKMVMTLFYSWSFFKMSLETGLFRYGYKTVECVFVTNLATTGIALVVQVISDVIMLVGLYKKNAKDVKAALLPSAVCFTMECLAFTAYFTYFVVVVGFQYFDLKMALFLIMDISLQLASAFVLLMIRKYYLKLRYEANILQDEANMEPKPKFEVLI